MVRSCDDLGASCKFDGLVTTEKSGVGGDGGVEVLEVLPPPQEQSKTVARSPVPKFGVLRAYLVISRERTSRHSVSWH